MVHEELEEKKNYQPWNLTNKKCASVETVRTVNF